MSVACRVMVVAVLATGALALAQKAPMALAGESASGSASGTVSTSTVKAAPKTFHDRVYKVAFDYPADWVFAKRDGEISTFRLDARTAPRTTTMRAVTAMPENPYPTSTFSGAYFYLSVTPRSTDALCAGQASVGNALPAKGKRPASEFAGMSFAHGHDEQKNICTIERDEIYTFYRRGMCYRFDMAINNFCGVEVTGAQDLTDKQLEALRGRMEAILSTVRFDGK
jgi:hypothetical protein